MSCPSCKSDDWKLARFVHQSGLSQVNTSTTSVGVGVGGGTQGVGVGAGVGGSSTSGHIQTGISALSAPPKEPSNNGGTVYWTIAVLLLIWLGGKSDVIAWIIIIMSIILWIGMKSELRKTYEKNVADYKVDLAKWEITRICQRCGQFYVPADDEA